LQGGWARGLAAATVAFGMPLNSGKSRRWRVRITSFRDLYIAEVQELRNAEEQLADALMAEKASHRSLKYALTYLRERTQTQRHRLEAILRLHDANGRSHTDRAMQVLILAVERMLAKVTSNELRDAALLASAQKICHYQIAAYGSAAALAGQLDLRDDQRELHLGLAEKREVDSLLTQVAKQEVNQDALAAA
jgi:ferritin-like metal-binding protein YciE